MDGLQETAPRPSPKERTRRLLHEAARDVLRSGGSLTVPAVAEQAGVSRATAYRYFPSNEAVVLHATMSLADDPLSDSEWAPAADAPPADLGARAADLVRATSEWAFDHETELRTMLRLSLDPERQNESRRGPSNTNRHRWIASLLEGLPADVPPDARDRLADALVPLFGADAVVWTTDMARLPRDQAIELLAWMAQALIAATVHGW